MGKYIYVFPIFIHFNLNKCEQLPVDISTGQNGNCIVYANFVIVYMKHKHTHSILYNGNGNEIISK